MGYSTVHCLGYGGRANRYGTSGLGMQEEQCPIPPPPHSLLGCGEGAGESCPQLVTSFRWLLSFLSRNDRAMSRSLHFRPGLVGSELV